MSRFDRRLARNAFSPRPGTANCKLPSNKVRNNANGMQIEINNQKETTTKMIIEDVSTKNEKILEKLSRCSNGTERILLNHELRLNTIELNVDCLNSFDMNELDVKNRLINQEQEIATLKNLIVNLEKQVSNLLINPNIKMVNDVDNTEKNEIKKQVTIDITEKVVKSDKVVEAEKAVEAEKVEEVEDSSPTFE